ncbi:MAG: DMT family transporter, partial [Fibrobacteres bacterium]|nr:DMT family transporter [Fibrobacterota bacterium]
VKSPAFWLSVIVMLTGATLIIVFNPANQFDLNKGAFLLFICQIFWACYILVVKKILKFRNPVISMAYISTAIALFHLVPAIVTGQAAVYGTLPAKTLIIVILSGVFSIAASHTLFYNAVNKIGVVIANNGLLIQPLIVCLLSYLLFGEKLTPPQMGGGVLLILGAWLTYRAKPAVAKVE